MERNTPTDPSQNLDSGRRRSLMSRRQLLGATAGAVGALALGGGARLAPRSVAVAAGPLPNPAQSGIEHIVLVMMENRSFDHLTGWLPHANGRQSGLTYTDSSGVAHSTYALPPDFQGCARQDPDHSYTGGRIEWDNGACDGWLRANDIFSIGYYPRSSLSFLGAAAPYWTTCDQYFAAIMAETYPNRFIQHAAQTDRIKNGYTISQLPTIWDRLAAAGLTGTYYYGDTPFLALWGPKYLGISQPYAKFLTDCKAGALPNVSFVDPRFQDESSGTSGDDHPHADIRNGEAFLNQVYQAVTQSPNWSSTVLVINFDEWGGFFDHISPPTSPVPPIEAAAGNADGLRGFRVPALVISPWSRRNTVAHTVFDHASVLKMIEWRWSLAPLTVRDQQANNLATVLDFAHPNLTAPSYNVPVGPFGGPCPVVNASEEEWSGVAALAATYNFPPA